MIPATSGSLHFCSECIEMQGSRMAYRQVSLRVRCRVRTGQHPRRAGHGGRLGMAVAAGNGSPMPHFQYISSTDIFHHVR